MKFTVTTRRVWALGLAGAVALVLSLAACGSGASTSSGSTQNDAAGATRSDSDTTTAELSPFTMARFFVPTTIVAGAGLGSFDNLPMTLTNIESGASALPLLLSGDLAGISDLSSPPIVVGWARDIPFKIVWMSNETPMTLVAKEGIDSAEDLRGKKVAAAAGTVLQYFLERYLEENGMALSDVEFVDLVPNDMVSALSTGAIDAGFAWVPASAQMVEQGGHALATEMAFNATVFSEEFVDEHPETVQAFVCDMAEAHEAFAKRPDETYAAMAEQLGIDAREILSLLPPDTVVQPEAMIGQDMLAPGGRIAHRIAAVGEWMLKNEQVPKAPTLDEVNAMIDLRFAQAVTEGECG